MRTGGTSTCSAAPNAPLVIAEAERSGPVTNLIIPSFCITEVTDQARFSNDGLASKPYSAWEDEFERELAEQGPQFQQIFGRNRMRSYGALTFPGHALTREKHPNRLRPSRPRGDRSTTLPKGRKSVKGWIST